MGYYEKYSEPLDQLASKIGYRVRLSWIWHLENEGYLEIVLDIDNDGSPEVPDALRISITDAEITGSIDLRDSITLKSTTSFIYTPKGDCLGRSKNKIGN